MNTQDKELRVLEYLEGDLSPEEEKLLLEEAGTDEELAALLADYQQQERGLQAYYHAQEEAAQKASRPDLRRLPVAVVAQPTTMWRSRRWLPAAAAAAVLVALVGTGIHFYNEQAAAALSPVTVTAMSGRPQFITSKGVMHPLSQKGALPAAADRIKTPDASYLALGLDNRSSRLELNANSSVELKHDSKRSQLKLERGEVLVWSGAGKGAQSVAVNTPQLQATGNDSVFSVVRGVRGSEVSVLRGEVEVIQAGARRRLRQGESFSSTGVRPLPIVQRVAWSADARQLAAALPVTTTTTAVSDGPAEENNTQLAMAPETASASNPVPVYTKGSVNSSTTTMATGSATFSSIGVARMTDYLPASTLSFIEIPSFTNLGALEGGVTVRDSLKETSVRDFLTTQLSVVGKQQEEIDVVFAELEKVVTAEEIDVVKNSLGGSISIGLSHDGPILLAEVTENADRVADIINGKVEPWFAKQANGAKGRPRFALANNILVIGPDDGSFEEALSAVQALRPTAFAASSFLAGIRSAVPGSRFTAAADVAGIRARAAGAAPSERAQRYLERTGFANMTSVIAATSFSDQADNRALRITFDGERQGMLSWIGAPAPLGSLQFFSPDAHFISAARVKKPGEMLTQMLQWVREDSPGLDIQETEAKLAIQRAIADTLGNEIAIGLDNPILPVPNVKVAMEVIDPVGFHNAMLSLVDALNDGRSPAQQVALNSATYKDRLVVDLVSPNAPVPISYAILGDYVVFGPGPAFIKSTIDLVDAGQSIDHESAFLEALPAKSGSYTSTLTYLAPTKSSGETTALLQGFLESKGVNLDVSRLSQAADTGKPFVFYSIAEENRIDLFIEGVKGDYQMTGLLPAVANWFSGTTTTN
jgi:ferric-dicitrate binding protein FerR (iron transport regulator)